ncbi:MAG TPA: helix-hairpin-helix domain-containing protein [Bacteriovoracaceae bacterium]|nr:helix-hairpin-helix domain-containing protein [Bacteriovoracaceae bacterium]
MKKTRKLSELVSVGPATLRDFELLGINSVTELSKQNATELFDRLCVITKSHQDICVLDVFRAAIEQAKNPNLEPEKKNWWYWSRIRKGLSKNAKKEK